MINKLNITLKDWISIIASLVQYNCDYLAYDTDNTKDEAAGETPLSPQYFGCHRCSLWCFLKEKKYYLENMGYGPRSPKLNPAALNVHLLECNPDHPVSLQKRGLQFFQVQNQYPLCASDVYCKFIVRVLLVLSFFDLLSYHRMLFLPNLILVLSSVFSDSSVLLFYQLLISSLCL